MFIPLLPSKINGKLLFTLCRTCAETKWGGKCNHTEKYRALTGTWVSIEVQKAVQIGNTILQLHEAWHYEHTTVYDQTTGTGGLFENYINTFIRLKMEASGYPPGVEIVQQKVDFIDKTEKNEGVRLDASKVKEPRMSGSGKTLP